MTSKFNSLLNTLGAGFNLKDTARGFLRPKGQMGDWQHAARTFADDNFRLAPKAKFLYHVYFDNINFLTNKLIKYSRRSQKIVINGLYRSECMKKILKFLHITKARSIM